MLRALDPRTCDRVGIDAWCAETAVVERGWIHRSSRGFTRRANSSTPVEDDHLAGVAAVDWLTRRDWRGSPPIVQLSDDGRHHATIDALASLGVEGEDSTLVMVAPPMPAGQPSTDPGATGAYPVSVASTFDDRWHACWADVSGGGHDLVVAREFFASLTRPIVAGIAADDGRSDVAVGLGVPTSAGVYIAAMATRPECRGRGHARSIVQAIRAVAGDQPAVLNVVDSNPAVGLYRSLGFMTSHAYAYFDLAPLVETS